MPGAGGGDVLLKSTTAVRSLFCVLAVGVFLACRGKEPRVLATIDGVPVYMAEVEEVVGDQLARLEHRCQQQRYQLVESSLERLVHGRLLDVEASRRGMTTAELIAAATAETLQTSEQEVAGWYDRNRAALGGRGLEELRPLIEEFLQDEKRERAYDDLLRQLKRERDVVYFFQPFRADLDNQGAPALGPSDAPVTLVEFSDFECPYCRSFFFTLMELRANYGDRLRIVYRHYPLTNHRNALKAAEASLCAQDQGRFWDYHDLVFNEPGRLDVPALEHRARRLGLDEGEFADCLDSGRQAERVRRDMREGDRVAIEGTPALFVNGIPLPAGALPYEAVAEVIDRELERAGFY